MTPVRLPEPDTFRAYCITNGYREQYNEGLWDWLTANGYTQRTLQDKIIAASEAGFTWELI